MANLLGFLDGASAVEPEGVGAGGPSSAASFAEASEARQAPEGGPARDEHGRFAARAAASTPDPSFAKASEGGASGVPGASTPPGAEASAQAPAEPDHVPATRLREEQAAREALERQIAQLRAAQTPPRELTRDEQLEAALYNQNLRASRRFAEREHGKDVIAQVHDWAARRCDLDLAFNDQMRNAEDPYEAALQAYHREQILQTVKPNDLAAFKAWQAAQAQAGANGGIHPAATANTHQAAAPPRSLVTASGTGGAGAPHVPVGPGMAFANAITR